MKIPSPLPLELEELSRTLVDSAFKVHQTLGPGLVESVYEACLCIELGKRGIGYETQAPIPLIYEGVRIDAGLRLDLLVEKSIILELKAVEKLLPVHQSQLLTYLKLADLRLGLLVMAKPVRPAQLQCRHVQARRSANYSLNHILPCVGPSSCI